MWFRRAKDQSVSSIIVDIGSGSVGIALVHHALHEKPHLLWSTRAFLPIRPYENDEDITKEILRLLHKTVEEFQRTALRSNLAFAVEARKHVHCFLSAPWSASKTEFFKVEKQKTFTVTDRLLEGAIARVLKTLEAKVEKPPYTFSPLESAIVETRLNDYSIEFPVGKRAEKLFLRHFASMVRDDIATAVRETFLSILNTRSVHIHSLALSEYAVLGDIFPELRHYTVVNVGEYKTEIMLVREGELHVHRSYERGHLESLQTALKNTPGSTEEMRALLSRLSHGEPLSDARLDTLRELWEHFFHDVWTELSQKQKLPPQVFLVSASGVSHLIATLLSTDAFKEYTVSGTPFSPVTLDAAHFSKRHKAEPHATFDSLLVMETLFVQKNLALGRKNMVYSFPYFVSSS